MEMKDILKQHADAIDVAMTGFGEKLVETTNRLFDIEQKMSRNRGGSVEADGSLGDAFVGAQGLNDFAENRDRPGQFKFETKAILTSVGTSAGPAAPAAYRDTIVALPKRALIVRSLLNVIPVTTGSVDVPQMTARNNGASTVAEGGTKPQSDFTLALVNTPIRKIAHWIQASTEILADAPQLRGLVDTELLYGLALVEDTQLLLGDNTGVNLNGMMPGATAYSAATTGVTEPAGSTMIDRLGYAMLQCALADFSPDGVILHPSDWMKIRLLKNSQGEYLLGDPGEAVDPRLFGQPVVTSKAMPAGNFMVGEYAVAATLYDRMQATIVASTEDRSNFIQNLVTILAEERLALAIKNPTALIKGNFTFP